MCIREKDIIFLLSLVRSMQLIRLWSNSNSLVFAKCKCALDFQFITFTKYRLITVKYAMRCGKHLECIKQHKQSVSTCSASEPLWSVSFKVLSCFRHLRSCIFPTSLSSGAIFKCFVLRNLLLIEKYLHLVIAGC